ncbi:MAG: hypothetical protein NTY07_07300 [Bacteroidia bacterium]|nr:hypothetical protein [Bacteroidia bacterium]
MKNTFYLFSFLVYISTLLGCSNSDKPIDFDYGKIENNKYINNYFGCEISIPKEWVIQTKEQMDKLSKKGSDLLAGDNSNTKALLKASEVKTANLLGVFKYERGAAVDFNPNFMIIAENISDYPGIKSGRDYLFQTRKLLDQSQFKYDFLDSVFKKEKINNIEFYSMNAFVKNMNTEIKQIYFSTIIKGFSFDIILTYNNELQKQELISVIKTLKIK